MKKIISANDGVAAVEFALISPLLFVLLFGIIEFSALLYNQAVITNASREGARYAVTYYRNPFSPDDATTLTESQIGAYITEYVNSHILSFKDVNPQIDPPTWSRTIDEESSYAGWVTEVTINYEYDFLVFGSLIELLPGGTQWSSIPLSATTRMRDEDQSVPGA